VAVAEIAPQVNLFALFVQRTILADISTDTARRSGRSAIAELLVEICKRTDKQTNTDTLIIILRTLTDIIR